MQQNHGDEAHAEMKIAQSLTENSLSKDRNNLSGMLDNKPAGDGPADTHVDAAAMAAAAAGRQQVNRTQDHERVSRAQ